MSALAILSLILTHPIEFCILVQYKLYHKQNRDISAPQEHPTTGWDRLSMRRCWKFLDMTSRSFSTVIKQLEGDLARVICLFYLVLRGLDTIEDDMTIPQETKESLLRSFHMKTVTPGWTFNGSGENEKDRQLLVEYDVVVEEVNRLLPAYKTIIVDICNKMEQGMADFAVKAATTKGPVYLETIEEYDLYCHYVAGLVGEGLSRIWSASGKEDPHIATELKLSDSTGLLLQKTNIIRDYREDVEQQRYFWPREIWSAPEYGFADMVDMCQPGAAERASWVQTGMIVDALRHTTDTLDYLIMLRNQSVFSFCAIPAMMAIATLSLCFMNPDMFQRNIKIRKAEAANLIMRSTNTKEVAYIFRDYARQIHAKAVPTDPNFVRLSVACGKIEQWCEHYYPSFVRTVRTSSGEIQTWLDPTDARSRIFKLEEEKEGNEATMIEKPWRQSQNGHANGNGNGHVGIKYTESPNGGVSAEMLIYMISAFVLMAGTCLTVFYGGC